MLAYINLFILTINIKPFLNHSPHERGLPMNDQPIIAQEAAPKSGAGRVVRIVLQWTILGLLLFTCVMAAIRKFGG
jgi:hypothetical protein